MRALTYCNAKVTSTRATTGQFKGQFKGALERYTWVQFAAKLTPCHRHIWQRSAHQWGDGTLHMGSIRGKAHPLPDTAHSTGQHFSGAMECYMRGFDLAPELTPYCHNTPQTVSIPVGRWMKGQGHLGERT